jgi:protein-S-isoprenylcysteine O-methyltransferase Ste14
MPMPKAAPGAPSKRLRFPRWLALFLFAALVTMAHAGVPWGLSLLGRRYGWVGGRPGVWNFFPLALVAAGFAGFVWCWTFHFVRTPPVVELDGTWTPPYLLTRGPYQVTRNPIYILVFMIWLGWTLFYGSVAVLAGCAALWAAVTLHAVPTEERGLEARFGASYVRYKDTVPRWFGRVRR